MCKKNVYKRNIFQKITLEYESKRLEKYKSKHSRKISD